MNVRAGQLVVLSPVVLRSEPTATGITAGAPITFTPSKEGMRVWSGEGPPPPEPPIGVSVGDTYVDTISGTVYRLDPGE